MDKSMATDNSDANFVSPYNNNLIDSSDYSNLRNFIIAYQDEEEVNPAASSFSTSNGDYLNEDKKSVGQSNGRKRPAANTTKKPTNSRASKKSMEKPAGLNGASEASDSISNGASAKPQGSGAGKTRAKKTKGRVKIKMEFIENKIRRYTTFSKRKTGIMKKAYELSTLTGTQVMLLVASETGHVYTFATEKLQPMITSEAGKSLIQSCLSYSGGGQDGGENGGGPTADSTENSNRGAASSGAVAGSSDTNRISIENFQQFEYYGEDEDDDEDEEEDEEDDDESDEDGDDDDNESDNGRRIYSQPIDSEHFVTNNFHSNSKQKTSKRKLQTNTSVRSNSEKTTSAAKKQKQKQPPINLVYAESQNNGEFLVNQQHQN